MYKKLIFVAMLLCIYNSIFAQDKISYDLSLGVNKSIGKDLIKWFDTQNGFGGEYNTRKKYQNPCLTLLMKASWPITKKISIGVQTGAYVHFSEQYASIKERTTVWVPLLATGSFIIKKINNRPIGIDLSVGALFFKINDRVEVYTDGKIFNASAFYSINKKNKIKLGIEKQIDNVTMAYTNVRYNTPSTFNYHLNRLSFNVSYCVKILNFKY